MASLNLPRKPVVVAICLAVAALHLVTGPHYGGPFRAFVTGYVIDLALPFALVLLFGVGLASTPVLCRPASRAVLVFCIGAGVEGSQYFGIPLFGRTFDPLDLVMYAVGAMGAVGFEKLAFSPLPSRDERRTAQHPASERLLPRRFPGGSLRRLRQSDLAAFQAYRGIPEVGRYQGWSPLADAAALVFLAEMESSVLFQPGRWVQLGIAEPGTDALVGDIGLHVSEDGHTGEIGFTLAPWAQGRGLASAAVREALRLLFTATSVSRVLGITDARNAPSIRLLARLGFTCQEVRSALVRGEQCTEQVFVLTRDDDQFRTTLGF